MIPPVEHPDYLTATAAEIVRFAGLVANSDLDAPVPSCPGWDLGKLAKHTGSAHRWAMQIIATRAKGPLSPREIDLGLPAQRTGLPAWLAAGAAPLRAALTVDPATEVWTWGPEQRVGWWARRMLHETTVHRADIQLALGLEPEIEPAIAADAVAEFLANLPSVAADRIAKLGGAGQSLHLHATDGPGEWTITLTGDGFTWDTGHGKATVAVRGAQTDLMLLIYGRRRPQDADRYELFGEGDLLDRWLAATPL